MAETRWDPALSSELELVAGTAGGAKEGGVAVGWRGQGGEGRTGEVGG